MQFIRLLLPLLLCYSLTSCQTKRERTAQELRLNIYTEPPSLDPRKATDITSLNLLLNLFEGLVRVDKSHQPKPALAKSFTVSEDGLTYTFKLRNSLWSNGDELTSYDFLYAWKSILDPKFPAPFAYKLYAIKNGEEVKKGKLPASELGLAAPNKHTLIVTLQYPIPYFLELLTSPTFFPIHRKVAEKFPHWAEDAGAHFISNGPFILTNWDHENEILIEKNKRYWNLAKVMLREIHFSMVDDSTTEFYMFELGELDWAGSPFSNLPPDFISASKKEEENTLPLFFYPTNGIYYYKLNTERFPLNNVSIRKALAYAINREALVKYVAQGGQMAALRLVPPMPGLLAFQPLFNDADAELAKRNFEQGLQELQLTKEEFPKLILSYNTNREHQKIALAIQEQWREVLGIEVELQHFDWKVYLSKIGRQDYQIGRMGWIGEVHDPMTFLEPFKYKNDPKLGGNNDTGWEDPRYIALLNQAAQELDPNHRKNLLFAAEKLFISQMPVIPIYYIVNSYLKKPYVQGVYLSPLGTMDLKEAFIQK